jgi:hypothetical protein
MFTKDSRTENFLTSMGVEWKYSNAIKYSDLMLGWDKVNLSRPVPIIEDAVFEYASLIESGSPAPAVILSDTDSGFRVLDGVQRIASGRITGCTQLSAYIVKSDSDDLLDCISVLANSRLQGRAEPPEWTRRRAVELLVVERGLSADEVARMGGWKSSDLMSIARAIELSKAIVSIGGPELPDSILDVVASRTVVQEIVASSKPMCEFFNTVKRAKLSAKDAVPYADAFFAPISRQSSRHTTYSERMAEIKDDAEIQIRLHGRRGAAQPRDVSIIRTLKAAVTLLDEAIESGDQLLYVDEFFRLIKKIDERVRQCTSKHESPRKSRTPADMWSKRDE